MNRKKVDITELYKRSYVRASIEFQLTNPKDIKKCEDLTVKIIFNGVRWLNRLSDNQIAQDLELYDKTLSTIITSMLLTPPKKIAQIFIPQKTYDGEKYEEKDYFYAKKRIAFYQRNGFRYKEERLIDFLSDLNNLEMYLFVMKYDHIRNMKYEMERKKRFEYMLLQISKKYRKLIALRDNSFSIVK